MGEQARGGGHPSEAALRDFADGALTDEQELAVEGHLFFHCPDGHCCRVLHRFPNAIDAVLRAAARSRRAGRRRVSCTC